MQESDSGASFGFSGRTRSGSWQVVDEDGQRARELIRQEVALYLPVVATLDPTVAIDPEAAITGSDGDDIEIQIV